MLILNDDTNGCKNWLNSLNFADDPDDNKAKITFYLLLKNDLSAIGEEIIFSLDFVTLFSTIVSSNFWLLISVFLFVILGFGTGKFFKEKQEDKKDNIYSDIDEMLSSTLKNDDTK